MSVYFGIEVPKNMHWYAKDLSICIFNKERKFYPNLTDLQYKQLLRERIQKKYKAAKGKKTLIEILKEDYENVKKKEGI